MSHAPRGPGHRDLVIVGIVLAVCFIAVLTWAWAPTLAAH